MTLELSNSPGKPEIKTFTGPVHIFYGSGDEVGQVDITMNDFMAAAYYVLTNTELEPNDPRLSFVKLMKQMKLTSDSKNFALDTLPCWSLQYPGDFTQFKWKEGDTL
jgi:hypothetical protein